MSGLSLSLGRNRRRRQPERALASALAKCTGSLDLRASTAVGGEWPTIVDTRNPGSPMVQPGVNRRAAVGTDPAFPSLVFDGTDVYVWPLNNAINNMAAKWGFWIWFKPATVSGGALQMLLAIYLAAGGGASSNKIYIRATDANLDVGCFVTVSTGRQLTFASVFTANTWCAVYVQYDSSRGGDANLAAFINSVARSGSGAAIGAGATLTTLPQPTGSALVGGLTDTDTPSQAMANGSQIGPVIRVFNDNLTIAEQVALMAHDLVPT